MKVQLFVTCLVDQLHPEVGASTVSLLRRLGCDVRFDPRQTCCGQPFWNSGYEGEARAVARTLLDALEGVDHVVTPSGSCAAMIVHAYAKLFADDAAELARAERLAARTHELSRFLVHVLGREDVGARFPHKVTYHPSCHGLRLCGVRAEPLKLLGRVRDLELVPLERAEDCCGFGGTFAVKEPAVSAAIGAEKLEHVLATGATHLVGTDMGCLVHLAGLLRRKGEHVRPLHLAQVLESVV